MLAGSRFYTLMKTMKYKYVIISALLSVALFFSISAKSSPEVDLHGFEDCFDCGNCIDNCWD